MQNNVLTYCEGCPIVASMPPTVDQLAVLTDWYETAIQLKAIKEKESRLRDQLAKELFRENADASTESIDIGAGYILKLTRKLDYKLNNKQDEVLALVAILDQTLAQKLVKWTPELSISTYKALDAPTQALFNGCLTIKPAKPTLEVIPPKDDD